MVSELYSENIPHDAMYILFIFLFYFCTLHTYFMSFLRSYTFYLTLILYIHSVARNILSSLMMQLIGESLDCNLISRLGPH